MDLAHMLMEQLGGSALSSIGERIGADEDTTGSALSAAIPLLISGLARNAAEPQGAESIHRALAEDHDGSVLDDLGGFLSDPDAANGAGILGHVLGARQPAVTQELSSGTGLDAAQVGQVLRIAAPLVMGALGRRQRTEGLDTNGLAALLGGQEQQEHAPNPDLMGMLTGLLDADKDGSPLDEIAGLAGKSLQEK